ncbi:hypothetical protein HPP92_012472 [Vanilla planifolia]|uniref:Uncharacterized protein n=1 Tax=Vanilla planifolia TaxID=51239 RepID=A0A835QYA8_VANPL|nr:hypothetical protein HPP92_012863 [Vanilla planifolia]KAG0477753.1 hypothetical protein HPP92_012472 [Vanilla planifolia]
MAFGRERKEAWWLKSKMRGWVSGFGNSDRRNSYGFIHREYVGSTDELFQHDRTTIIMSFFSLFRGFLDFHLPSRPRILALGLVFTFAAIAQICLMMEFYSRHTTSQFSQCNSFLLRVIFRCAQAFVQRFQVMETTGGSSQIPHTSSQRSRWQELRYGFRKGVIRFSPQILSDLPNPISERCVEAADKANSGLGGIRCWGIHPHRFPVVQRN